MVRGFGVGGIGHRQPLLVESYGVVDVVLGDERTQTVEIIS